MKKAACVFIPFFFLILSGCSPKLDFHYSYSDSSLYSSAGWGIQTHSSCGLVILEDADSIQETRVITGKGKPSLSSLNLSVNSRIEVYPEDGNPKKAELYYVINGKLLDLSNAGPFGVFLVTKYGDVIRLDQYHFSKQENAVLEQTFDFWHKKVTDLNEDNSLYITDSSLILNILGEMYGTDMIKEIEEYLI